MNLLELIKKNRLTHFTLTELTKKLCGQTNEAKVDIENEINQLLEVGDLFLDEDNKILISEDKGYLKAKITVNKKGYGFASVEGYPDFFIPAFALNGAFDGDNCLVEITNMKTKDEIEARVVKVTKHNTTKIVGTLVIGKSKIVVFPDDEKFPQIRILKSDTGKAKNNDKVWVELDLASLETKVFKGKVLEVLGKANTVKAEQLSIIRSFNLIDEFKPETLENVKKINQTVELKNFKNRKDFTKHKVITIDGEDARDFDDALSVEKSENGGCILYVHIADVSNYVTENSALDKEAFQRGTSVYFPNQVIPMLPKEISNGICSLKEGENRLTLSVVISLDKNCKVLDSYVTESVIRSSHRMTYTELTKIFEGNEILLEKYADVYDDLLIYREISNKLKNIRKLRGEIRMNLPEPFILENENGEIVSIEKRVQDEAHEIIESLMVLANECVAKKYFDLKIPFVYRVHEKPDEEKAVKISTILKNLGVVNTLDKDYSSPMCYQKAIEKISGSTKEESLTKLILRSLMKAKYHPICLGHFGLASEFYCHFTSPIRRYPDLMIHRIIKEHLHGKSVDELKAKYTGIVEKASIQSSLTERNADEAEREVDDYKKALYMKKFLGSEFDGIISGVQEFGVFVELENGIEGLVRVDELPFDEYVYEEDKVLLRGRNHSFTIGDSLRVLVANVNERNRQIDFDLPGSDADKKSVVRVDKKQKVKTSKKSKTTAKSYYKTKLKIKSKSKSKQKRKRR